MECRPVLKQIKVWLFVAALTTMLAGLSFANKNEFVEACMKSNNMGRDICECCADIAQAELSPSGVDFLTASLKGDSATTESLRGQLSMTEMIKASMFMVNTPARCAGRESEQ